MKHLTDHECQLTVSISNYPLHDPSVIFKLTPDSINYNDDDDGELKCKF